MRSNKKRVIITRFSLRKTMALMGRHSHQGFCLRAAQISIAGPARLRFVSSLRQPSSPIRRITMFSPYLTVRLFSTAFRWKSTLLKIFFKVSIFKSPCRVKFFCVTSFRASEFWMEPGVPFDDREPSIQPYNLFFN